MARKSKVQYCSSCDYYFICEEDYDDKKLFMRLLLDMGLCTDVVYIVFEFMGGYCAWCYPGKIRAIRRILKLKLSQ